MQKNQIGASVLGLVLLAGCTGKGLDAPLTTTDEASYRASLDAAWVDMTEPQQAAFNWAVSDLNLQQLAAKYPSVTPREVIRREADEYLERKTQQAAQITAELAAKAEQLAAQEAALQEVEAELAKISATGQTIQDRFGFGKDFVYEVRNGSRFNLSSAQWNAWLYLNDEDTSTRHCKVYGNFKHHGGLRAASSMQQTFEVGFMHCENWNTLEVQNAKNKQYLMELEPASVKNFDEQPILPARSTTRADYETAIAAAQQEAENAKMHRTALQ